MARAVPRGALRGRPSPHEAVSEPGDPLREAIEEYHEILDRGLAAETQAQLEAQLRSQDLYFGDRPLCTVLRPRFLTPEQYRFLQRRIGILLGALGKAYAAALEDDAFRASFGLTEWEEELIAREPRVGEPSPVSRLDAFFASEQEGLRFTEYNAETPAGAAYGDLLASVFLGLPVMRRFLRRWEVRPLPARHHVMHALVAAYRAWAGDAGEAPRVGILDWREVPTFGEFRITAEYLTSQGIESVIADPREVEYRDGKLVVGDFHVTLIYKRVLIRELIERCGIDHGVVRAVLDGAACMVNPFRCKILHKKMSLAVLGDERNEGLFTSEERRAIADHIPWTRRVEERRTRFGNGEVDLVPFVHDHRERFVLKPNDDYGGAGIVLGWEVDATGWEAAVRAALALPYVVQERVPIPSEPYPTLVGDELHLLPRILDTAPFCFGGAYMDGCLTRLSTASLVNVTAGGGSNVPTFVVRPR